MRRMLSVAVVLFGAVLVPGGVVGRGAGRR